MLDKMALGIFLAAMIALVVCGCILTRKPRKKLPTETLRPAVPDEHQPGCFALEEEKGDHWTGSGRQSSADALVEVSVGSPPIGYFSIWPEWAYEIAKDALLFNRQVVLMYSDAPFGPNLHMVFCSNRPV